MGISLDMLKGLEVISFTVHIILLGLWNQEMPSFFENDMISGSDQLRDLGSEIDHIVSTFHIK